MDGCEASHGVWAKIVTVKSTSCGCRSKVQTLPSESGFLLNFGSIEP